MELRNKYLNQANFFTRSVFKLDREIHKDIVYLIQSKTDFFGKPQSIIKISLSDYLGAKSITKNDTYSFLEFYKFADEIKNVGGAFYNKINRSFVSFNLVDNVQIDNDNPETLQIELGRFGKIFFYREHLQKYIAEITPFGNSLNYTGHSQVNNTVFKIKGGRRKKFFEIISQFKNTGFCKISVMELKSYLGYIEVIDKKSTDSLEEENQLKFIFIPQSQFEFRDKQPKYSYFERDFLIPAINSINKDINSDIKNLRITKKTKTGRKISHLEFQFTPLNQNLTKEDQSCINFFESVGLDKTQVLFLLRKLGYQEMVNRWKYNITMKTNKNNRIPKYYEKKSGNQIKNLSGYLYTVLFKELQ